MSGQTAQPTVIERLVADLTRPVDAGSRTRARLHLLDWLGCATLGRQSAAGDALSAARSPSAEGNAAYWGGLGNVLEMDDVDKRAILHPGPTIVPAALAMALAAGAGEDALLDGLVRGYEAVIHLGRAVGPGHYAQWHSTGTCGAIGAAAAAGFILGLDAPQMAHALALASSQSAGLWHTRHDPASFGKQLHTAHAARAGITAARLARAGFTGPLAHLEGAQGFFAAMCPGADPETVLADYGPGWRLQDVSFKPWPACRHAHAVIDAALDARNAVALDEIEHITVATYADALKFCDEPDPKTVIDAKFSLQHSVAVALLKGPPGLDDFSLDAIASLDFAALRGRVECACSEAYDTAYPARFGAELRLQMRDGQEMVVAAPDALGDPENPMSEDAIRAKATSLMSAAGLTEDAIAAALSAVDTAAHKLPAMLEDLLP